MQLQDDAYSWLQCPEKNIRMYRGDRFIGQWGVSWDAHVTYVTSNIPLPPYAIHQGRFFREWAETVVKKAGRKNAYDLCIHLTKIFKEADIDPEMTPRWNDAIRNFIYPSIRGLISLYEEGEV